MFRPLLVNATPNGFWNVRQIRPPRRRGLTIFRGRQPKNLLFVRLCEASRVQRSRLYYPN